MSAIQNFAFEEHLVRVVDRAGEPWFVGKDVCAALGLRNHNDALSDLDDDEKGVAITDPLSRSDRGGGPQETVIVSEPGVYRLVFRSRKPEAERFKRWIAHEVLPQIRKTGFYGAAAEPLPTLDNASMPVLRAKIDLVREARIQFGAARARRMWVELGLPLPPDLPPAAPDPDLDPEGCLETLLARDLGGRSLRAAVAAARDGDAEAVAELADFGVRLWPGGILVSTNATEVLRCFAATRWCDGLWLTALRAVPGARPWGKVRFAAHQSRATFVPL